MAALLILCLFFARVSCDCQDVSYSSLSVEFGSVKKLSRIAISGHISAFAVDVAITDDTSYTLKQPNGQNLVVYSTLSHVPSWTHVDVLSRSLKIRNAFGIDDGAQRPPMITVTICEYETPISAFDDSPYTVDSNRAGLVSMYENELILVFRSFRSGIFLFSMADQGDVLIAQIVHGTIHVIFDFGSLTPSRISAGRALDDGRWHEVRWLHQFDSVQLSIDGVLLNQTTPSGLYRKLDLHNQIHIAGRPTDDFSEGIESTFTGCIARLQLNSADLLQFAPRDAAHVCSISQPSSFTMAPKSVALLPFSFLPFSFEFRILSMKSVLLDMVDASNVSLVRTEIDENGGLVLLSNVTKYKQKANPGSVLTDGAWHSFSLRIRGTRLEVDVDGLTVLWLEGQEVRRVSVRLASLILSAPGCYRSATVDFGQISTSGDVRRGMCQLVDRCQPSPCENGGTCQQTTLSEYVCNCATGHKGKNCHTSEYPRSCEEWLYLRTSKIRVTKGRNVTIDLDGGGPLLPFNVICKMEKDDLGVDVITTTLNHDLTRALYVTGDTAPGAVRKQFSYGINTEQMDRLVEGFEQCSQWMKYTCRGGARLMTHGQDRSPSSWYSTRSDKHGLQWGDAPPYSRMCSCAANGTCLQNRMCNCDSGEDTVDEGVNTYSQLLPVTGLFLGGTSKSSSVEAEIGPLICSSRVSFNSITFTDRNARLAGSRSFNARTFDVSMHLKFTHLHMTIFAWESADALHWFHLYTHDGKIVAEIVNGGETSQLATTVPINDGKWHSVSWEADTQGMRIRIDGKLKSSEKPFILPTALHWSIGSRTQSGNSGYAGVIRNFYLCGEELMISTLAHSETERGISLGEDGVCRPGLCRNGGVCVDRYDDYDCDCSQTPFGGSDCTKEYGMFVAPGSSLEIPWQNPAHSSQCHRIAIQTRLKNISLMRSKALFAESSFNMTVDKNGALFVAIYDGVMFTHKETFNKKNLSDDVMHDIAFCAIDKDFNLTVDGEKAISFRGNWSFFEQFNFWKFLDEAYTGCVSRLQVGASFPLKDPKAARLTHSGKIRFGSCPLQMSELPSEKPPLADTTGIHIHSVSYRKQMIVSYTSIAGLVIAVLLVGMLSILICYMRSRPEGVYKTNEGGDNCSPSRSEEPLVHQGNQLNGKEYFC